VLYGHHGGDEIEKTRKCFSGRTAGRGVVGSSGQDRSSPLIRPQQEEQQEDDDDDDAKLRDSKGCHNEHRAN
jgi:hypothetical protein